MKKISKMTLEELRNFSPIFLTEPQACWSAWYKEERASISGLLPSTARISHIGSTVNKTIWAKPIIDILVEVPEDLDGAAQKLTAHGWVCMNREDGRVDLNRGYTEQGFAERVFHLHLRLIGDHDELYFRDYLTEHPEAAAEYEDLKLRLWKQYEHDRDGYTAAKRSAPAGILRWQSSSMGQNTKIQTEEPNERSHFDPRTESEQSEKRIAVHPEEPDRGVYRRVRLGKVQHCV